jgi:ArsR family transcriptional regulator
MQLKEIKNTLNALADETRFRIVNLLSEGELCVCDLMRVLGEPQSKISRHLAYLRRAKVVSAKKEGLWMYYRLVQGSGKLPQALVRIIQLGRLDVAELRKDLQKFRKSKSCLVACCK